MWKLDHKKGWGSKNWCFWIVVKKTLESPLDCKEIKPVSTKGNQPWIFIGRTVAETEAPILWSPDVKSWFVGKDWCWERLKAKVEGGNRGWDCWMALLTQWTWVWANSRREWRTGKPGVLQFIGSRRVRHDLTAEQQPINSIRSPRLRTQPHSTTPTSNGICQSQAATCTQDQMATD